MITKEFLEDVVLNDVTKAREALLRAFPWNKSPEGQVYWEEVERTLCRIQFRKQQESVK